MYLLASSQRFRSDKCSWVFFVDLLALWKPKKFVFFFFCIIIHSSKHVAVSSVWRRYRFGVCLQLLFLDISLCLLVHQGGKSTEDDFFCNWKTATGYASSPNIKTSWNYILHCVTL